MAMEFFPAIDDKPADVKALNVHTVHDNVSVTRDNVWILKVLFNIKIFCVKSSITATDFTLIVSHLLYFKILSCGFVKLFLIARHCAKWFLYRSFSSNWIMKVDSWWLLLHFKSIHFKLQQAISSWNFLFILSFIDWRKIFFIEMKKSFVNCNAILNGSY